MDNKFTIRKINLRIFKTLAVSLIFLGLFTSTKTNAQVSTLNEGFNVVSPLPTGWAFQNLSSPIGTIDWFQGNTDVFNSQAGAPTAYIAANFNNTSGAGTISNWLFTPVLNLSNGKVFEFWTRTATGSTWADRLEVRMSTNGASVNAGTTSASVGDFSITLLSINQTLAASGYPQVWTKYTITLSGIATPTTGRIAFRYFVPNGGPSGANSNFIGIDEVAFSDACSGTPVPGNTISSSAGACSGVPFTLSLQNPPLIGQTVQWQSSTDGGTTWTNITGATNPTYSATQTVATSYRANVSCGALVGTSTPIAVSMNPPLSCYCIPTPPSSGCDFGDYIANVTVGGINNTSTCSATGAYSDYTTSVAAGNLIIGAPNSISVTVGNGGTEYVGVWIDYNRNGQFEATEFQSLGSTTTTLTGNINVPGTTTTGSTRMRVRVKWGSAVTGSEACTTTGSYGEVEDYTVNFVPCVPAAITTQPTSQTISCGGVASFSATVTGSVPSYQWQYRTNATAIWQNVTNGGIYSGATTNTLTLTNVTATYNGYQYRLMYAGACAGQNPSNAATLTVNPIPAMISNTLPINRCISSPATAINIANPSGTAVTASGNLHTVIPDTNDGDALENTAMLSHTINVNNVPAGQPVTGFRVKLNITHSYVGDLIIVLKAPNGKIISLDYALTGTGGTGSTTGFTNTVISSTGTTALSSGSNPYTGTFKLDNAGPSPAGFTPTGPAGFMPNTILLSDMYQGNGAWTLALYDYWGDFLTTNFLENWELSLDYGNPATGIFTPSTGLYTNAAGTTPYTGTAVSTVYAAPTSSTTYSLVVTAGSCSSTPLSIPVNVSVPVSGTSTVNNAATCEGGNAGFKATAPSAGTGITYQWQVSTNGGTTWTNVANGTNYAGATTDSLTVLGALASMNNNQYRVVMSVAACTGSTLNSSAGTLSVTALPSVSVSPATTALLPGQTVILTAVSTPANPANVYTWYYNGVPIAGQTGNTITVGIDGAGVYTASAATANACGGSQSGSVEVTAQKSNTLFIYPNPTSNGQFQVRYWSEPGNSNLPRLLSIYDNKGARVYTQKYIINAPYTQMNVNLSNLSKGIYNVDLTDGQGNRIKTGRVVIN